MADEKSQVIYKQTGIRTSMAGVALEPYECQDLRNAEVWDGKLKKMLGMTYINTTRLDGPIKGIVEFVRDGSR